MDRNGHVDRKVGAGTVIAAAAIAALVASGAVALAGSGGDAAPRAGVQSELKSLSQKVKKATKRANEALKIAEETSKAAGPQGPAGQPGENGTALAYAYVTTSANLVTDRVDESLSKGVSDANVSGPGTIGYSCFHDLGFTVRNVALGKVTYGQSLVRIKNFALCPAGTQIEVETRDMSMQLADFPVMVLIN